MFTGGTGFFDFDPWPFRTLIIGTHDNRRSNSWWFNVDPWPFVPSWQAQRAPVRRAHSSMAPSAGSGANSGRDAVTSPAVWRADRWETRKGLASL